MTTKKTGRKSQKVSNTRLSRALLEKSVADLKQRLNDNTSLRERSKPAPLLMRINPCLSYVRTVLRAQMETLVQGLDDAYGFAQISTG